MNIGTQYKILRTVAVVLLSSAGAYGLYSAYQSPSASIKVLEGPAQVNTPLKASTDKSATSCENLEKIALKHMDTIIQNGYLPTEVEPLYQTFMGNVNAMSLHKCDKATLYSHLNKYLTLDDPLYFELNGLL